MNKKYVLLGLVIILLASGFFIWKTMHHVKPSNILCCQGINLSTEIK